MAKSPRSESKEEAARVRMPAPAADAAPDRVRRTRQVGDLVGDVAGTSFRRFGFVQSAVVSRWAEIVGERYAKVSTPESIRFPAGKKSSGTLTLSVEGAHAPLLQHLGPLIIERVNRFFGYEAVAKVAFRQGRGQRQRAGVERPVTAPVPQELGENLRKIADPELRTVLESLAGKLAGSRGAPAIDNFPAKPIPIIRSK